MLMRMRKYEPPNPDEKVDAFLRRLRETRLENQRRIRMNEVIMWVVLFMVTALALFGGGF